MMGKIYEFAPVIYPTKVWVAFSSITIDEIDKVFDAINGEGYGVPFKSKYQSLLETSTDAVTFVVGHKKQNITGCLVVMKTTAKLRTLSHEADHCADYLFEQIGDTERSYEHGETYAYYQSWVFDCLYKVRGRKV